MRRGVIAALALALALVGCSDDKDDKDDEDGPKSTSDEASAATPGDFCASFEKNGGSETALRPVPANQPRTAIQGAVDRALRAMDGVTAPQPIARQWTALSAHYEAVIAEIQQLAPDQRLPGKRQRALQKQTERVFDDSGRAVVNFVLQHCS